MERKKRPTDLAEELERNDADWSSLEHEVLLNIIKTSDTFKYTLKMLFKPYGISGPQYNVLKILTLKRDLGEERVPVGEIRKNLIERSPDVTRLLDGIETKGLASRKRSKRDRRVVWIAITGEGRRLVDELEEPLQKLHRENLGHLGEKKLRLLNDMLFEARYPKKA